MRTGRRIRAAATAVALSMLMAGAANAAEIVLVTTGAVEQIMLGLIPAFERETGHMIRMSVFGTPTAVAKIKEGSAVPDLVLLSPEALGELAAAGKVAAPSITNAFRSRVGVAVRAGAPKPDISTAEAFKRALLNAKSIGHSIGPSGEYFSKVLLPRLGIADTVRAKMTVVRGAPVATAVAKGEVQIGIHQIAELMPIPGIEIVGPLPPELQTTLFYATGMANASRERGAAAAFVKFIMNEAAVPVIRRNGMEPA
jgi:molybdate transport system substrate-binding protein